MRKETSWPCRQRQRNQCQWDGTQDGFNLYPACLAPHLRPFHRIFDMLHCIAQFARPARSKANSRLIAPLKEAHRRAPEQKHEREPPPPIGAGRYEHG